MGIDPQARGLAASARQATIGTVSPEMFGAVGDGIADDTAAVQRWADYLNAHGGAGVARQKYRLATKQDIGNGVYVSLYLWGNDISIDARGATFTGAFAGYPNNYRPIFIHGGGKLGGSILTNRCIDATAYQVSGAIVKGAQSVPLATPSDAANYAPGDVAFLRSGEMLNLGTTSEPSSELLEVFSADPATGIVTFATPIAKNYTQEYFVSGTSGITTSSVTANPAIYGLANVTSRVMRRFRWAGGKLIGGPDTLQMVSLWGIFDGEFRAQLQYPRAGIGARDSRNIHADVWLEHDGTDNATYCFGPSTGCSDWDAHIRLRSKGFNYLHIHENVTRSRFHPHLSMQGSASANNGGIDINSRATDIEIIRPFVDTGSASQQCIYIDASCGGGGSVIDPTLVNNAPVASTSCIINNATNWKISGERLLGSNSKVSHRGLQVSGGFTSEARTLEFAVTSGKTTCTIPACYFQYDQSLSVQVDVVQAFNAGAGNTISLGYSTATTALLNALAVTSTGPVRVGSDHANAGSELGRQTTFTAAKDLILTFTGTGAAPTTGKVLVTLTVTKSCRLD